MPEGESLKSYGFREDISCLRNSSYFKNIHPVLSSSTNELIDAGVDGYFTAYPSNSTVLLRRKVNMEPALLYYPYGNGMVILTSMFTDWAFTHSQATTSEIKIIRDLITFAKNPHLPIPMYDLASNPTPPGAQYDHMVLLPTTQFPTYLKGSLTVRIQYYDANNILKQIGAPKVIFLMGAMTESTLKLNGKQNINQFFTPGSALNLEISSHHLAKIRYDLGFNLKRTGQIQRHVFYKGINEQ